MALWLRPPHTNWNADEACAACWRRLCPILKEVLPHCDGGFSLVNALPRDSAHWVRKNHHHCKIGSNDALIEWAKKRFFTDETCCDLILIADTIRVSENLFADARHWPHSEACQRPPSYWHDLCQWKPFRWHDSRQHKPFCWRASLAAQWSVSATAFLLTWFVSVKTFSLTRFASVRTVLLTQNSFVYFSSMFLCMFIFCDLVSIADANRVSENIFCWHDSRQ